MEQRFEPMLTPKEVAALLGVTERTLHTWRAKGGGPRWSRAGDMGQIRYNPVSVREFASGRCDHVREA